MEPIGIHNNPHEIGGGIVVVVSESHLEVAHNKQVGGPPNRLLPF